MDLRTFIGSGFGPVMVGVARWPVDPHFVVPGNAMASVPYQVAQGSAEASLSLWYPSNVRDAAVRSWGPGYSFGSRLLYCPMSSHFGLAAMNLQMPRARR